MANYWQNREMYIRIQNAFHVRLTCTQILKCTGCSVSVTHVLRTFLTKNVLLGMLYKYSKILNYKSCRALTTDSTAVSSYLINEHDTKKVNFLLSYIVLDWSHYLLLEP